MFKWLLCAFAGGLAFFGAIHVWMRFEGSPDSQIESVLIGWLVFAGFCSVFSAMRHGCGLAQYLIGFALPIICAWGASFFGVTHPVWAIIGAAVIVALLCWGAYEEYLDTPFSSYHRPVRVVPGLGAVIVRGNTPRAVRDGVRALRKREP